jgi:hypothetical protein
MVCTSQEDFQLTYTSPMGEYPLTEPQFDAVCPGKDLFKRRPHSSDEPTVAKMPENTSVRLISIVLYIDPVCEYAKTML